MSDQERNLNPHKPAVVAMWIFSRSYSSQNEGSMDFWDTLTKTEKNLCGVWLKELEVLQKSLHENQVNSV